MWIPITPLVALILALPLVPLVPAQEKPITVDLTPKWKVGWQFKGLMTKQKFDIIGGEKRSRGCAITEIKLDVIKADPKGYYLMLTFGSTKVTGLKGLVPKEILMLASTYKGLKLKLSCRPDGMLTGILNKEKVTRVTKIVIAQIRAHLQKSGKQNQYIDRFLKPITAVADKYHLILLNELAMLFVANSLELQLGVPYKFRDTIKAPLFTDPIGAKSSLLLEKVDWAAKSATVIYKQALDPKDLSKALKDFTKKMMEQGTKFPAGCDFDIKDTTRVIMDLSTGMARSVTFQRVTRTNKRVLHEVRYFNLSLTNPFISAPASKEKRQD